MWQLAIVTEGHDETGARIWVRVGKPEMTISDNGWDEDGKSVGVKPTYDLCYETNVLSPSGCKVEFAVVAADTVELLPQFAQDGEISPISHEQLERGDLGYASS
jgi:hypothetical protein